MPSSNKPTPSVATARLFAGLSEKQLAMVAELITSVQVKAGTDLTAEGSRGLECGVLLDGTATVKIGGEVVATLAPGDHYGEMAMLDDGAGAGRRTATVTTVDDQLVAVMSVTELRTVLAEFPEIAAALRSSAQQRAAENDNPR